MTNLGDPREYFLLVRRYEADVAAKHAELCPDGVSTPQWFEFCAQMDEWNRAVYEARRG